METDRYNFSDALAAADTLMSNFRAEIAALRAVEESGEVPMSHLKKNGEIQPGVNVDDLVSEDASVWQKIKEYPKHGPIADVDWKAYSEGVEASGNPSRKQFLAFLNNKRVSIIAQEFLKDKNAA